MTVQAKAQKVLV